MKIAIVGAGPAGLACACQLLEQGHDISMFERMQDLSQQGSGVLIQAVGLAVLDRLNLRESAEKLGRRITQINGRSTPSNRTTVRVNYRILNGFDYALAIDRSSLWTLLYNKACTLGLLINSNVTIKTLKHPSTNQVVISDQNQRDYGPFELVIDASGARSELREFAAHPTSSKYLDYGSLWAKVKIDSGSAFNQNVMTLFSDSRNVGIGLLPTGSLELGGDDWITLFFNLRWQDWDPANFELWKTSVIKKWPQVEHTIEPLHHPSQLYMAKFIQHTLKQPYGERIIYIGDAAHSSNPSLGQGINMSLVDAVCLPWALEQADIPEAIAIYTRMRRNHVAIYQTLSRLLTPFYQSNNRIAVSARDIFYPLFSTLFSTRLMTARLISGQVGNPLKHLL